MKAEMRLSEGGRISFFKWRDANQQLRERIIKRSQKEMDLARNIARDWIAKVERYGDDALVDYIHTFDDPTFTKDRLRVTTDDISEAYKKTSKEVVEIIRRQIEISTEFHQRQLPARLEETAEFVPGVVTGWRIVPIQSVGLTVPAGQVPLPTVMQILTVAAKRAGVPRIVACFPPTGKHYEMLIAADIAGVDEIYRVGGIAGVAAMSVGTETIRPVLKIVGPGSIYTQAAKMEVSLRGIAIDMLSGPSEALLIADESADPRYCAADILARCEHDQNACAVLATTSQSLAKSVLTELYYQLPKLRRKEIAEVSLSRYSAVIVFDDSEQIITFANDYGAEHLEILTDNPWEICKQIENAGSIFLGHFAPVAVGDYASGTNHCLPTGVATKTASPVGVETFLKKSEIQWLTKEGLRNLEPIVTTISRIEKLDAHTKSVQIRLS